MSVAYPQNYRLAAHGDGLEQEAWGLFLANEFPSYEIFWQRYVVPVTNRPAVAPAGAVPQHLRFKMDSDDHQVCVAQLHYSVLWHLSVAWRLKSLPFLDINGVANCIVRLNSALDIAEELLQRHARPGYYDPWSEERGEAARRTWRDDHPPDKARLRALRDYRNHLIHGRIPMTISINGVFRVPRIGKERLYLDWRKAILASLDPATAADFATPHEVVGGAWQEVTDFLESRWQSVLG